MATVSAEPAPHDFRAIKIGIVGNSNSVMNNGYVKTLEQTPGLAITNRSIGSSPNVVLLDFLGRETVLDYDFIIIETAVVDFIQAGALYPRERSQETLELFIGQIRSASRAQVIILTIPTRYALLAPDAYWQEQLYRDTAARLGVPILDGFRLIRQLIGQAKITAAGTYLTRAEQLAAAFGLPGNLAPSLAWRDLRDRFVHTNALGVSAFVDHAHFSGTIHALVGSILADFIVSAMPDPHAASVRAAAPGKPPVIAIDTQDGSRVVRTSTLMSRNLGVLRAGDTASYQCPPGYRAYGLLLNQSLTFCFLKLTSPTGGVAFDMRFKPLPFDWIAVVVPIIDRIGDGVIEVTAMDAPPDDVPCRLLHNTDTRTAAWCAELGEMILVREDWRDHFALPVAENAKAFHLEDTAWAKWAIEEAALRALPVVQGIETDGWFVPSDCGAAVANLLIKGTAALSLADQARLLLVLGMADRLPAFFQAAISIQGGDEELRRMYDAVRASRLGETGAGVVPSAPNVTPAALAPNTQRVPNTQPVNVIDEETPVSLPSTTQENATAMNSDLRSARPAIDAPLEAWIRTAEQAEAGDRIALLGEALERFPEDIRLLHDLARAHEKQRNWTLAETYWRRYIARDRRHWWIYSALAAALRAQDRGADGDIVLHEAVVQFPDEPQILAEVARAAQIRGDLAEATRTWDLIIARFPGQWIGYRGKAHTLAQGGQHAEADQLTETLAPTLPDNTDALHDLARLAERRRDWKRAETAWRSFVAREQRGSWAYLALAHVLREQALYPEAQAVLRDALPRFPNDADLSAEAARCAELLGDLVEAARFWQAIATLRPKSPDGPLGEADMLRRYGQTEAADTVIVAAIKRLPDEPLLLESHGLNAIVRNAWGEALTRLETAQRRFPSNDALRQRIYEVRLKIADEGGSTPPAMPEHEGAGEDRALVMQFESLGGGGHGCEFGFFQRHFGAEPLGLLRWADIFQDHLSTVLETEFAGVGDPEFTNIFVPENSTEYWTTDTRYHMVVQSSVPVGDVPLDRMRQQVTKRFKYLSRKLADDLRSGTKIFVYKNMKRNLTDAELRRLHAACRRYGDNTLLYIRYEDAGHPSGTVVAADDGLLIGYIDHFSHTPDTDEYVGTATDALLLICRRAHSLWQEAGLAGRPQEQPVPAAHVATPEQAEITRDYTRSPPVRVQVEDAVAQEPALPEPLPARREECLSHIDLLTRQGQNAEARNQTAGLINQGANNTDLLYRAVRLAFTEGGFDWIRDVWPRLVATIPDRQRNAHEASLLFRQYCHDQDCQFLLTWMMSDPWPDRISELPPLLSIVSQSRATAHREAVDSIVVRNLHLIDDPMLLRVVRCLLHLFSDPNDYADLVADILERATEHDMPKALLITLAGSGRPYPALIDAIGRQLRALIETPSPLPHTADARIYLLVVLGDVLFPSDTAAVLGRLARERGRSDDAATLAGVLSTMAHAHPLASAGATLHSRPWLKICLCLSGQLRGYKAAFKSWEGLGLWNHDVAVVAHVWRDIGLRTPDNRHNAARAFSGEFLTAYQDVLESRGWGYLADNYPKLLRRLTATNHVDEPELRMLYSADAIVVEDEDQPEFAGRGNFWKMHYKVKSAHQLGRRICPGADLYIRARPDQDMSTFASIDWHDLHRRANSGSVIFTDSKRFFAPPWIWMDDRFAIGSGANMDIYTAAFDHVAAAAAGRLYGYPDVYLPHACFGSTTQYFNIAVEDLPSRQPFKLLNPPPMEPEEVATLIRADMQGRGEIATDAKLLSAIETDLGALAGSEMADRLQF
jgi:tetratricopeptide (TPR) repeat protein